MVKVRMRFVLVVCVFLSLVSARGSGPAYVREAGLSLVLGNDVLERTISIAGEYAGTTHLLNKISQRAYPIRGHEFELRLINERVGYEFRGENPVVLTGKGRCVAEHAVEDVPGGKRVVLHLGTMRDGRCNSAADGIAIDLVYELRAADFFTRSWVHVSGASFIDHVSVLKTSWGLARFSLGGYGQPVFGDDIFMGVEYPTARNQTAGSAVDLGMAVGLPIPSDGYTTEPAVIGVAPVGRVHQQFLEYVDRMRVTGVRPYLLYNSWYDLQRLAMNHENTLERVSSLNRLLLEKYGLKLNSFVLDDGWDDMHKLWAIDRQRFPRGFGDLVDALQGIGSRLGMWFGPIGGYDQRAIRIATGKQEGMEVTSNGKYLCIAGRNYNKLLSDTMVQYQKEYGINYYKIDGVAFGCNEPEHGHPPGVYSDEAVARSLIGMLTRLRREDPQVFLNITTSIWLSPWWLRYADTVWMGGQDSGYLATVPTMAPRQSAISYRDAVLYNDFVIHGAQFPMSSLMTHGIIKGKYNMLGSDRELIDDWRDEVVHYYMVGNMMYELYISPDLLSAEEMDALGKTTKWAIANAHPLLDNSTMVLGDPAGRAPYGYVHSSREKSIAMLRNPFVRPATVRLKIDQENGFYERADPMRMDVIYPYREMRPGTVRFGDTVSVELGGYEEKVIELRPARGDDFRMEGVPFSVSVGASGSPMLRVYAPNTAAALSLSPGTMQVEGAPGTDRTVRVKTAVDVPADYREARIAFLVEPDGDGRGVRAEAVDNGSSAPLVNENGGGSAWQWFWFNLAPGRHSVGFTFYLPSGSSAAGISGWVLTKRALGAREVQMNEKPVAVDLLPTRSDVEWRTYELMDRRVP